MRPLQNIKEFISRFYALPIFLILNNCNSPKLVEDVNQIKIEKIIFHYLGEGCEGFCSTYYLQIDSTRETNLFSQKVYKYEIDKYGEYAVPKIDTSLIGHFTGLVDDSTYLNLIQKINEIGIDTAKFKRANGVDGINITIVIYYNGTCKCIKPFYWEHQIARKLIDELYNICKKNQLKRISKEFTIPKTKIECECI